MNVTLPNITIKLVAEVCASCGTHFGVDERLDYEYRETGKSFFCPNGHSLSFKESEIDRLRKEAQALKARAETAGRMRDYYESEYNGEKRGHAATKGQLTRTRKRIANGVCPECNRHFANVERHMESKHKGA